MKRIRMLLSVLLALLTVLCAGCGDPTAAPEAETPATEAPAAVQTRPEQYSPDEYILYQNVFYQDYGKELDGSEVTKEGVFGAIYDAYSSCMRYYVWGYYDQTKCCDWQWEFVPQPDAALPPVGSLITVTGTFAYNDSALDKYWIQNADIALLTAYGGPTAERDMCCMSCTLERVQMYNILYHADVFEGQKYLAYGRIASADALQDPYYDNSWQIGIAWDGDVPAIGTLVELSGTVEGGALTVDSMEIIQ